MSTANNFSFTKKTAIFSLLDAPAWGGAEEYVIQNLSGVSDACEVMIATNNDQVRSKIEESNLTAINLPYVLDAIGNWKGLIKYFLSLPHSIIWITIQLIKLRTKYKKVICVFPGYSDRLTFSPIVKLFGCKLIWWEFGPLEPTFRQNWGFPKLLFAISRRFPDQIITISNTTKKSLLTTGKIEKEKVKVIYPGTANFSNKGVKIDRENIFLQINEFKSTKKTILCCLGRLTKEKEFEVAITAISKLPTEIQRKIHLFIIGEGPNRKNLQKLTKNLHLTEIVSFTGFVSDAEKWTILENSDIFIFPSMWELEGFGITTIEAMMTENAIITAGHGPQSEIITKGKTGLYFEPKNSADLADQISQLVQKPKLRDRLQSNAKKRAMEKFSLIDMQTKFQQLLTEI